MALLAVTFEEEVAIFEATSPAPDGAEQLVFASLIPLEEA